MQIKKVDWEIEEEAKRYLGNDNLYYVLQGRLGNQLFGLSEAFRIHKKLSKKIVIDISEIILNGFSIPNCSTCLLSLHFFKRRIIFSCSCSLCSHAYILEGPLV